MKKTLTANISGTVFHIEEDAYEALNRYLTTIRGQFDGSEGRDEIMADIEGRIAELFTERLTGRGQVVTKADVEHVISVMGQPEDYLGDTGEAAGTNTGDRTSGKRHKRLFRDPEDRWAGGVLGGLAAYLGADPMWLRIPFILLVILGVGSPILIYLIMWVLVPPATSAADRLMMEGEPVTVDNLKKAFEEGGQRVAKEVEDLGERWRTRDGGHAARSMRSAARRGANATTRAVPVIVGFILFIVGSSLGVSLIGAILGGSIFAFDSFDAEQGINLAELGLLLFPSGGQALWFSGALFLVLLIPVVGLLTAGLQLMLGLRAPRWLGWSLAPLWVVALIVVLVIGLGTGRDLRRSELMRTSIPLENVQGQVLHLSGLDKGDPMQRWSMRYSRGSMNWDWDALRVSPDSVHGGWARLDVQRSHDTEFHLRVERNSQGSDRKSALIRSGNISYNVLLQDSMLALSPWLAFPKQDKLRAQRLRFVVLVPMGKAVHFDDGIGFMLDDVKNVTNTLDRDMVGRTWTMTPNGLSDRVRPEDVPDDLRPAPASNAGMEASLRRNRARRFCMPDPWALMRSQ